MSSRVVLPLVMAVFLSCCGKSPETSRPAAEPAQGEKSADAALSEASEAALNAALAQLTQAVRRYSFERKSVPKTVGEVVTAGYLPNMPQAPAGKKFAIDARKIQVVLVDQ